MVEVSGVRRAGPAAVGGSRPKSVGGFAVALDQPVAASGAMAAGAVHPSILALQEAAAETVGDREAKRHGQAMLKSLAALQHEWLRASGSPHAALQELSALVESVPEATSPPLAALLRAVALRARIELARTG